MRLSGWGRYPSVDATIFSPFSRWQLIEFFPTSPFAIRGFGRSYGDSSISSSVLETLHLDHYMYFDEVNGILTCEAGVSINDILSLIIPKGWFMPVSPGTSFVSIGGAIASDVHGKNHHHSGTLSQHLIGLELLLGNGDIVKISKDNYPDLFWATCGGMGLTGVILAATIKLKQINSGFISQVTMKASCLEEIIEQFDLNQSSTYSVAWIDCLAKGRHLGRSLLMLGEHSDYGKLDFVSKLSLNIPIEMPAGLLNSHAIKAFNAIYYGKFVKKPNKKIIALSSYFYPLDSLHNWNRLYGKNGFVQYQFVIPKSAGVQSLRFILNLISNSGQGSFLAVLKKFGAKNQSYLSFPIEGYTLALDFKLDKKVLELIQKLDSFVISLGGRVYLAKDALLSEKSFKAMYSNWENFEAVREKYYAIGRFSSNQSRRLGLQ
jgi:decaprenylphospho-beta-D-ribofuranose 2-oxidase